MCCRISLSNYCTVKIATFVQFTSPSCRVDVSASNATGYPSHVSHGSVRFGMERSNGPTIGKKTRCCRFLCTRCPCGVVWDSSKDHKQKKTVARNQRPTIYYGTKVFLRWIHALPDFCVFASDDRYQGQRGVCVAASPVISPSVLLSQQEVWLRLGVGARAGHRRSRSRQALDLLFLLTSQHEFLVFWNRWTVGAVSRVSVWRGLSFQQLATVDIVKLHVDRPIY